VACIGRAHRKATFLAASRSMTSSTWNRRKELVAFGRKPADHDQLAFRGIHALHPLILLDEGLRGSEVDLRCGGCLGPPTPNGRLLAIGMDDMRNRDCRHRTVPIAWPSPSWQGECCADEVDSYAGETITGDLMTKAW
jgi:hypothetical protein